MSNNNSILFVGIAAAVLLCGATAGIAIACMNSDTAMTDEQLYLKGYSEGRAAALNGDTYEYVDPYLELMSPYDYGYQIGFGTADKTQFLLLEKDTNAPTPDSYAFYLEYVEIFNNGAVFALATGAEVFTASVEQAPVE